MKYLLCSILLIYFFFASGISYELFTPNITDHVESPYNIGLSAPRTGIVGIATEDDIQAIEWLKGNAKGRKIVSDYNGYCIVHGYVQNHVDNLRYGSLTDIKSGDLIFLSSWNIRNQKYIEAIGVGVREVYRIPDEIYSNKVLYGMDVNKLPLAWDGKNHWMVDIENWHNSGAVILEKE